MLYIIDISSMRHSNSGNVPSSPDDQVLLPGVIKSLRQYKNSNDILVGYSSHPKTSFNKRQIDAWKIEIQFNHMIGDVLDDIYINMYDNEGPNSSLYQDLTKKTTMVFSNIMKKYRVTKQMMSFVTGNKFDFQICSSFGIKYMTNYHFFNWDINKMQKDEYDNYKWPFHELEPYKTNTEYIVVIGENNECIGTRAIPRNSTILIPSGPLYKVKE